MNSILRKKKNFGYSLIEMVIYVSLLSMISVLVVNTILSFTGSYKNLLVLRKIEHSGISSMERMTRDIRNSSVVEVSNSTLNQSPGVLTVSNTNSGTKVTTKFYVQDGVLKVDVDGAYDGPVTISDTNVSNLVFSLIDNGASQAVKIDLTVESNLGDISKSKTYHSTVVLRGS